MPVVKMINYETPLGTFADWNDAAAACEKADLDPCSCIVNRPIEFRDVCVEWAYGTAFRVSDAIRVF